MKHPNLMRYYDAYQSEWKIRIPLEFMDSGSLKGRHIIDEVLLVCVAKQMLSVIAYLHS